MKILTDTTHNGIRRVTIRSYALLYIIILSRYEYVYEQLYRGGDYSDELLDDSEFYKNK